MKSIGIGEVRRALARLDDLVAREGEVVITRCGRPIARLLPLRSKQRRPLHAELRASMPRLKRGSESYVRTDRDER
mgnify:CR=1 FL=1